MYLVTTLIPPISLSNASTGEFACYQLNQTNMNSSSTSTTPGRRPHPAHHLYLKKKKRKEERRRNQEAISIQLISPKDTRTERPSIWTQQIDNIIIPYYVPDNNAITSWPSSSSPSSPSSQPLISADARRRNHLNALHALRRGQRHLMESSIKPSKPPIFSLPSPSPLSSPLPLSFTYFIFAVFIPSRARGSTAGHAHPTTRTTPDSKGQEEEEKRGEERRWKEVKGGERRCTLSLYSSW